MERTLPSTPICGDYCGYATEALVDMARAMFVLKGHILSGDGQLFENYTIPIDSIIKIQILLQDDRESSGRVFAHMRELFQKRNDYFSVRDSFKFTLYNNLSHPLKKDQIFQKDWFK